MKKFILLAGCLFALSSAHATTNTATMYMKISGDIKNTYYLCISNAGCINLIAGVKGKSFPINPGHINYIFMTNAGNIRMYPQPLSNSCQIALNKNQTLTVSGKITKAANDTIYIKKLHCSVA